MSLGRKFKCKLGQNNSFSQSYFEACPSSVFFSFEEPGAMCVLYLELY